MATKKVTKPDDAENDSDLVTVEEAQAIFEERPDVANVATDQGILHRDGTLTT